MTIFLNQHLFNRAFNKFYLCWIFFLKNTLVRIIENCNRNSHWVICEKKHFRSILSLFCGNFRTLFYDINGICFVGNCKISIMDETFLERCIKIRKKSLVYRLIFTCTFSAKHLYVQSRWVVKSFNRKKRLFIFLIFFIQLFIWCF